jgi:hypothetical protein
MPAAVKFVFRAMADFGDEYRRAIVDRLDHCFETVFLAVTALAIEIDAAMADEFRALGAEFINLELLRVAKVLVDAPLALGGDGDQDIAMSLASSARRAFKFGVLRRDLGETLLFDRF